MSSLDHSRPKGLVGFYGLAGQLQCGLYLVRRWRVGAPQGRRAAAPTARETHGEASTEWQLRLLRQLRRFEDVAKQLDSHAARGGVGRGDPGCDGPKPR